MKNVILILGILTTVMVCGVVAGVSTNASPPALDMDLTETQCRVCHVDNLQDQHHPFGQENDWICSECHDYSESSPSQKPIAKACGSEGVCHISTSSEILQYLVTDHHDFNVIFSDNDDWDCLSCHEQGVPRPFDK